MLTDPIFTHGRPGMDLGGTWKFCPDPMQRSSHQEWWIHPSKKDAIWPCWDPEGLWDIQVPGTWKTQFEELKWYDGHATYLRDFRVDKMPEDSEAFLCFDGVVYETKVYLNGQFMGRHEWGYSPFAIRVTDVLRRENRMFVLVDNTLSKDRVPGQIFDWNNDGGIIGPVRLVFVPRVYVENFRVSTRIEGANAAIAVDVHLASRDVAASETVTVSVPELGLEARVTAAVGVPVTVEMRVPLDKVTLWSPDTPKLYRVALSTARETIADEVGLREIRASGREMLLNGKPVRLYGCCVHAEYPGTGRTATAEGIARYVDAARDLGFNFFRCAHYPYSEAWGRAMDKAGLMWWEEVPAYWLQNMHEEHMSRMALGMMREAIRRDWNRASIIIWSVSNECTWRSPDNPDDNNLAYWFRAAANVRALDPSRLTSCAEMQTFIRVAGEWQPRLGDDVGAATAGIEFWRPGYGDEWYALFDVFSGNFYVRPGESLAAFRRYADLLAPYNKPLIISEFGHTSLLGAKIPDDEIGSEARHSRLISDSYEAFAQVPEITGYCPWCLLDIRVPIHWRWYNSRKAVFRYGVMDEEWNRKKPYFTLRDEIGKLKRALARPTR